MGKQLIKQVLKARSIPEAMQMIEDICRRAADPPRGKVLRNSAEYVRIRTLQNWLNQEDPEGNPWKPVKRKMPPPILVQTGLMMTQAAAAGSSPKITNNEMLISAPMPKYNIFHLESRPWLGVNEKMIDEIAVAATESARGFALTGVETG